MKYLELEQMSGSLMAVVPHQDDEVLLCGGVLYQAKKLGMDVKVVMVTNGDCDCKDYTKGEIRLRETVKGMEKLGILEEDIVFLGYADTGMPKEESFLMKLHAESDPERVFSSFSGERTYGLPEKPEYHMEQYGEHAPYTRAMVKRDLAEVLLRYKPDHIITTSPEDTHGDHAGLYLFLEEILEEAREKEGYDPAVFCGLVHSAAGDDLWPEREGRMFTCPGEPGGVFWWEKRYCFLLPEEMRVERGRENLKYQALLQYETALEPGAYDFLMSFIKDEEIFRKVRGE